MRIEHIHERIGVQFFHIEDPVTAPNALHHHGGPDHGGDASGVADRLIAGFFIGCLMRTNVLDVERFLA